MKLDNSLSMPSLVKSSRDNIVGPFMVDIAERDIGNGIKNINIIIFLASDSGPREKYEPIIKKTCIEIFRTRENIDLVWRDEPEIQRQIGLPRPVQLHNSWLIDIQHPRSLFFKIDALERYFISSLSRGLQNAKV